MSSIAAAAGPEDTKAKTFELFVPGRVCLFGEHSDWSGAQRRQNSELHPGACIVAGTTHGIRATVSTHNTLRLHSITHDGEERLASQLVLLERLTGKPN